MIIHGIELTDNMDIKDIIALFNALIVSSETTATELDKNHKNYAEISTVSTENLAKYKAVLEAINTLQINATETVETALKKADNLGSKIDDKNKELYASIKKHNQSLYDAVNEQIKKLKEDTKTIITEAMNNVNIDTSDLSRVINAKIEKYDLSKLDSFIRSANANIDQATNKMNRAMSDVQEIEGNLKESINSLDRTSNNITIKTEEINDAVKNINSANKSISMATTLAMLFVGIVIGAGVMTYFKIDAVSDYYFSSYDKKVAHEKAVNDELMEQINNTSQLEQWLIKNKIKLNTGTFTDTREIYISVPKRYVKDHYISKSGSSVTILR